MSTRISRHALPHTLAEPSPACGRGQGEGSRLASDSAGKVSSRSPHPDPLPPVADSSPLPSRERPFDKRSGGPAKWEVEGARAEIATIAPPHDGLNKPSPACARGH